MLFLTHIRFQEIIAKIVKQTNKIKQTIPMMQVCRSAIIKTSSVKVIYMQQVVCNAIAQKMKFSSKYFFIFCAVTIT